MSPSSKYNQMKLKIVPDRMPSELRRGLAEIKKEYPLRFSSSATAISIDFVPDEALQGGGLAVEVKGRSITIRYARKTEAFRALGRVMGMLLAGKTRRNFNEHAKFEMLGIMLDVSRNGVLRPQAVKALIRRCALMGINMLILYTEDTYEVPGEPFFGYLRGRYTRAELRDLDRYADALGIEMFPCIQTLAHLQQVLQWPAYAEYCDTAEVILAEDEKVYALLEKMIAAASAPFKSKRIHVGMDEALGIGTGKYRRLRGIKEPFEILNQHLARVCAICAKRGLRPMIWSDMYFRLGSKVHDYYDRNCVIPRGVSARIPKQVELVYWDYYHADKAFYCEWIDRHRALGFEPVMAGGIWTWNRFWAALPASFTSTQACMQACKEKKLKQVFMTMWGDDGMECDIFSALPGMQFFAEHGYANEVDQIAMRHNFRGSCDADFDAYVKASGVDAVPLLVPPETSCANFSKWLLWQDPFLGMLDPQIADLPALSRYYARLAKALFKDAGKFPTSRRLLLPANLAQVLSLKCVLRSQLASAYRKGDRRRLRSLMRKDLKALRGAVDELWRCHRKMWLETYKPFGLEVLEGRYGGLRIRLESLEQRLRDYLAGDLATIPELETKLKRIFPGDLRYTMLGHARAATPSALK